MSQFWKQYEEYIVTIAIFCVGAAFVWFGIIPMHQKIKERMNKSQEAVVDREIRTGLVASIASLREQKKLVDEKESQMNMVISKSNIVDLVKNIESLAKETDNVVTIDAKEKILNKPAAVAAAEGAPVGEAKKEEDKTLLESLPSDQALMIAINLTGDYNNIIRFISKLESMQYETDVVALSVSVKEADKKSSQPTNNPFSAAVATPDSSATDIASPVPVVKETLPLEVVLDTVVYVNEN